MYLSIPFLRFPLKLNPVRILNIYEPSAGYLLDISAVNNIILCCTPCYSYKLSVLIELYVYIRMPFTCACYQLFLENNPTLCLDAWCCLYEIILVYHKARKVVDVVLAIPVQIYIG